MTLANQIRIVDTTAHHVLELAKNMRSEDALEAERLGFGARQHLYRSYRRSVMCRTGFIGNEVGSIWGVVGSMLGSVGTPWLVTSSTVRAAVSPLSFALIYREQVKEMNLLFPTLENWVDSTYNDSIRLMKIIGFQLDDPLPYGKDGAPFRRFWLKRKEEDAA